MTKVSRTASTFTWVVTSLGFAWVSVMSTPAVAQTIHVLSQQYSARVDVLAKRSSQLISHTDIAAPPDTRAGDRITQVEDETTNLVAGEGYQDISGFSALKAIANDEEDSTDEAATTTTRYFFDIQNDGTDPVPMHLHFQLAPTDLHLEDFTAHPKGVPGGATFDQKANIEYQISGRRGGLFSSGLDWFTNLSGGAGDAQLTQSLNDPQSIGSPALISTVAPGSTVDAMFNSFSGDLDFGNLDPGTAFELEYIIKANVQLQGVDNSGPSGGSVSGGDPLEFGNGNPNAPAANFVFTAGDFVVPEPAITTLLAIFGLLNLSPRRCIRGESGKHI